jgi:hypothetical protein
MKHEKKMNSRSINADYKSFFNQQTHAQVIMSSTKKIQNGHPNALQTGVILGAFLFDKSITGIETKIKK